MVAWRSDVRINVVRIGSSNEQGLYWCMVRPAHRGQQSLAEQCDVHSHHLIDVILFILVYGCALGGQVLGEAKVVLLD